MVLISWGMEGVGKQVKLNKRGDCNKQREGAQHIILYQQKSAHSEFIPFSCDVQHCD